MRETFIKRLRHLRKTKNKTQQDMAEILNIQRSTYGEYERGNIHPPAAKIKTLADFYGVSVDYLIGNTDVPTYKDSEQDDLTDISQSMTLILEKLKDDQSELLFAGTHLDDDTRELLLASIENSLKMGKMLNRKG